MAVLRGQDAYLATGTTVINGKVDASLDFTATEIPITTQDSAGWEETLIGDKSGTGTFSGLDDPADTHAFDEIYALFAAGTAVTLLFGNGIKTTGGRIWTLSVLFTGVAETSNHNQAKGWSFNFKITGVPALATSTTTL